MSQDNMGYATEPIVRLVEVQKVTPQQVVIAGRRFMKSNAREIGGNTFRMPSFYEVDFAVLMHCKTRLLGYKLRTIDYTAFSNARIQRIWDIVQEHEREKLDSQT